MDDVLAPPGAFVTATRVWPWRVLGLLGAAVVWGIGFWASYVGGVALWEHGHALEQGEHSDRTFVESVPWLVGGYLLALAAGVPLGLGFAPVSMAAPEHYRRFRGATWIASGIVCAGVTAAVAVHWTLLAEWTSTATLNGDNLASFGAGETLGICGLALAPFAFAPAVAIHLRSRGA